MKKKNRNYYFDKFATQVTKATGRPSTFIIALIAILIWALIGPLYSVNAK